jgi:hypothetical protein
MSHIGKEAPYHPNAVERERESKDALLHQKRRITREWAALNRLRKRYAAADAQHAADNTRLSDEYQHVARAFNHLQHQSRRCKAANRARFEQVLLFAWG